MAGRKKQKRKKAKTETRYMYIGGPVEEGWKFGFNAYLTRAEAKRRCDSLAQYFGGRIAKVRIEEI